MRVGSRLVTLDKLGIGLITIVEWGWASNHSGSGELVSYHRDNGE